MALVPTSVFDAAVFQSDPMWARGGALGVMAALEAINLDYAAPLVPVGAITLGAAAGTSPSALAVTAGSNQLRGQFTFTSGSATPAGGTLATIVFPVALTGTVHAGTTTPFLYIALWWGMAQTTSAVGTALSSAPTVSGATVTGFIVYVGAAITASTAGFAVNYLCFG